MLHVMAGRPGHGREAIPGVLADLKTPPVAGAYANCPARSQIGALATPTTMVCPTAAGSTAAPLHQALFTQLSQNVACNRLHDVQQRCARCC